MKLIEFEPFRQLQNFNDKVQKLLDNFQDYVLDYEESFYPKIDI